MPCLSLTMPTHIGRDHEAAALELSENDSLMGSPTFDGNITAAATAHLHNHEAILERGSSIIIVHHESQHSVAVINTIATQVQSEPT